MREQEVGTAVSQLALLGVSAAQIAKQVALPRKLVDTTLAVMGNEKAREPFEAGASLDDAAIYAEFADDLDALAYLDHTSPRNPAHAAEYLRRDADRRHALRPHIDALRAEGLPVLDPHDVPNSLWEHRVMGRTIEATGETVTPENAHTLPTAALIVHAYQCIEDDDYDDEGDATAEGGFTFETEWIVTDPTAAGLRPRAWGQTTTTPTEEETEAQKQAKRDERRRVITHNKEWDAAQAVRREWLATFTARKTAPTGAEAFIAHTVATHPWWFTSALDRGNPIA